MSSRKESETRAADGFVRSAFEVVAESRPRDAARVLNTMADRKAKEDRVDSIFHLVENDFNIPLNPLSEKELAAVKETWGWLYDEGIVRPEWYSLYKDVTGEFHPDFIGNDVHLYYVESKLVDSSYIRGMCDKNVMPLLLPWAKHPKTLIRKLNGVYLDEGFHKISEDEAVNNLMNCRKEGAVIKLCRSSGGKGLTFISERSREQEIRDALREAAYITVQGLVTQHPDMAKMNPTSVNTIRLMTIMVGGVSRVVSAVVRIGGMGSQVDNFHSGGMSCGINPDGTLHHEAVYLNGERAKRHKNGFVFATGKVPYFDKVCETVTRMHYCLPMFGIVSWDICIDEEGDPVLIEYNIGGGVAVHQLSNGPLYGPYRQQIVDEVFKDYRVRGATLDYSYDLTRHGAVITRAGLEMDSVSIPATIEGKPVTAIGASSFKSHERLRSVEISGDLERIGSLAFYNCKELEEVVINGSVRTFERSAFNNCPRLAELRIPEGTKTIGKLAFAYCPDLKEIYLPDSLSEMAADALERSPQAVIFCSKGSYAEWYALRYGRQYRIISR